jgi:lipopolysaccharide biosynthesis glycosyltransferase
VSRFAVVYCVDESYVDYAAVSGFSLLMNSQQGYPKIYVFSDLGEDRLEAAFGWMYRESALEFVHSGELAGPPMQMRSPVSNASWWTQASWLRIFVPDVVPTDRMLYLDSDTIVDCDVADVARCDIGNATVGGVRERLFERSLLQDLKKEPGTDIYLNTGVLMIDCDAWRRTDATDRIIDFQSRNACRWIDQDAINGALGGAEKAELPWRYNVMLHYYKFARKSLMDEYDGGIIHYSGADKPWHSWMNDSSRKIWQAYHALSPLRHRDISISPRNFRESLAYGDKMASEGRHQEAYRELRKAVTAEMKEKIRLRIS